MSGKSNINNLEAGLLGRPFSRRSAMKMLGTGALLTTSGCGSLAFEAQPGICKPQFRDDELIVDVHCHIMNLEDADRQVFVRHHILNTDERVLPFWDLVARQAVRLLERPAVFFVQEARAERLVIERDFKKMMRSFQSFCDVAADNQDGVIFAGKKGQPTGFLSNRARNVARYMATYRDVDLFLPSMVDFNGGAAGEYSSVPEQAFIYSQLAAATRGRALPLISYHPGRGYAPGSDAASESHGLRTQLSFIEYAIEKLGFVGVKIHPSTGFAVVDNADHACISEIKDEDSPEWKHKAKYYDTAMHALYCLCRRLDVPILSHGSLGVLGPKNCIENPDKQGYSPAKWVKAVRKANGAKKDFDGNDIPSNNELRVCIAHFADRFRRSRKTNALEVQGWLQEAAASIEEADNIYLDLSDVSNWFEDVVLSDGKRVERVTDEHQAAFRKFLADHPKFKTRIMYGTDWHMPDVAKLGPDYLSGVREMVETVDEQMPGFKKATMGGNAVDFFRLRDGDRTRGRIESFLRKSGTDPKQVKWCEKVDGYYA